MGMEATSWIAEVEAKSPARSVSKGRCNKTEIRSSTASQSIQLGEDPIKRHWIEDAEELQAFASVDSGQLKQQGDEGIVSPFWASG